MKFELNDDGNPFYLHGSKYLGGLAKKETVELIFCTCGKIPSEHQINAADAIKANGAQIREIIAKESIHFWNTAISENPRWFEGTERLADIRSLESALCISRVYVHNDFGVNGYTTVGYSGDWPLDVEHAYGLTFKFDHALKAFSFLEVGHQDIAFSDAYEAFDYPSAKEMAEAIRMTINELEKVRKMKEDKTWRMAYSIDGYIADTEKFIERLKEFYRSKYANDLA